SLHDALPILRTASDPGRQELAHVGCRCHPPIVRRCACSGSFLALRGPATQTIPPPGDEGWPLGLAESPSDRLLHLHPCRECLRHSDLRPARVGSPPPGPRLLCPLRSSGG